MVDPAAEAPAAAPLACTEDKSSWWSPELSRQYAQSGYVVLKGFYGERELKLLRDEAAAVMGGKEGLRKCLEQDSAFFAHELEGGGHHALVSRLVGDAIVGSAVGYFDKPL